MIDDVVENAQEKQGRGEYEKTRGCDGEHCHLTEQLVSVLKG